MVDVVGDVHVDVVDVVVGEDDTFEVVVVVVVVVDVVVDGVEVVVVVVLVVVVVGVVEVEVRTEVDLVTTDGEVVCSALGEGLIEDEAIFVEGELRESGVGSRVRNGRLLRTGIGTDGGEEA